MRIFLTGGSGFVGTFLVPGLLALGHTITCLVHPSEGPDKTSHLEDPRITIVRGDVCDSTIDLHIEGHTLVIHMAGMYRFLAQRWLMRHVNVLGTDNVMRAAHRASIRVIYLSSCTAYGRQPGLFDEEATIHSHTSLYGKTKYKGDERVRFWRARGLIVTILYPASILGRGDPQVSGAYIRALVDPPPLKGGTGIPFLPLRFETMTWVHITDVIDAILACVQAPPRYSDYLVGGSVLIFQEMHDLIAQTGLKMDRHPRLHLPIPSWTLMLIAHLIAFVCLVIKRPPPWGLCPDQIRTLLYGIRFTGERARQELLGGRPYTHPRHALEDFFSDSYPRT